MSVFHCALGAVGIASLILSAQARAADPMAYPLMLNTSGTASKIATLDLATGTLSNVVSVTLNGQAEAVNGLAYLAGTSSYYTNRGNTLYSVNVGTGALTPIGSTGLPAGFTAPATTTSAAYEGLIQPGSALALYQLNPTTAQISPLGSTAITPANNTTVSSGLTGLYVINDEGTASTGRHYAINAQTGSPTFLGDTGVSGFRGLIGAGGSFYSVADAANSTTQQKIYTVNLATGGSTFVQNVANTVTGYFFETLAPVAAAVPEPGKLSFFALGLIAMLATIWRRQPGLARI